MTTTTRDKLVQEAEILFADKGFYGTSISGVATQLDLTKQGLLHYFPSKEKLYGVVLEDAATYLISRIDRALEEKLNPQEQLLAVLESFAESDERMVRVSRLFVRELLDNPERANSSKHWVLAPLLGKIEDIIKRGQKEGYFKPVHPIAFIYHILGAQQYFIVSLPTLQRIHSKRQYKSHIDNHFSETIRIIKCTLLINPDD